MLVKYLQDADLVVLPYKMGSVLNSGTVILSFSYGKSVICPNIGTINDIEDKSAILNYGYICEADHKKALTDTIDRAIFLKQKSPTIFKTWGLQMKKYILKNHNTEKVVDQLAGLYHDITK
jgi:glycosyltransferase involved in cell wall biosynthesis